MKKRQSRWLSHLRPSKPVSTLSKPISSITKTRTSSPDISQQLTQSLFNLKQQLPVRMIQSLVILQPTLLWEQWVKITSKAMTNKTQRSSSEIRDNHSFSNKSPTKMAILQWKFSNSRTRLLLCKMPIIKRINNSHQVNPTILTTIPNKMAYIRWIRTLLCLKTSKICFSNSFNSNNSKTKLAKAPSWTQTNLMGSPSFNKTKPTWCLLTTIATATILDPKLLKIRLRSKLLEHQIVSKVSKETKATQAWMLLLKITTVPLFKFQALWSPWIRCCRDLQNRLSTTKELISLTEMKMKRLLEWTLRKRLRL